MIYKINPQISKERISKKFIIIFFSSIIFLLCCTKLPPIKPQKQNNLKTLEIVKIEPKNLSTSVKLNTKIILKFNNKLDPSTLKTNFENNLCIGTIQISTNNFRNCVRMKILDLVNSNKNIILTPEKVYDINSFHKIKLTKGIKSTNGTSLKKEFVSSPGFKTTWSHLLGTSGDDMGFAVSIDTDNNIFVAGHTSNDETNKNKDLFITKYTENGFQKWIKQPKFGRSVSATVIRFKNSNEIFLSAFSKERNNSALLNAIYSSDGKKYFSKTILLDGNPRGNGIAVDKEGYTYFTAATPFDILKIGPKGKKLWGIQLKTDEIISAITADSDNNLYITGNIKKSPDGKTTKKDSEIFILKLSQMGPKLWSKTYRSKLKKLGTSIAIKSDKDIAIVGHVTESENLEGIEKKNKDAFVAKYDFKGKLKWIYIIKGPNSEQCTVALWTKEGDLLVGGFTESMLEDKSYLGKEDAFLAKFNNFGELIWLKQFGTKENERPMGLAQGRDGQIYVTGFSEGNFDGAKFNGGRDIFLVKFNNDGEKQ